MPAEKPRIGNPLERAAQLGKLGGKRDEQSPSSGNTDAQASSSLEVSRRSDAQTSERPGVQESEHSDTSRRSASQTSERSSVQELRGSGVQTLEHPNSETSRRSGAQVSKHPDWVKQTSYMPLELQTWLRMESATTRLEISEIMVEALEDYRARRPKHF
jgi:hypothetical protein